jgi:hypothetical protein
MTITSSTINIHWNYFLSIEYDLEKISRYVEFDKNNFECFSVEISRVILAAGAEVDVVCKKICKNINPSLSNLHINTYREIINQSFKDTD